jgi:hypothetical protein
VAQLIKGAGGNRPQFERICESIVEVVGHALPDAPPTTFALAGPEDKLGGEGLLGISGAGATPSSRSNSSPTTQQTLSSPWSAAMSPPPLQLPPPSPLAAATHPLATTKTRPPSVPAPPSVLPQTNSNLDTVPNGAPGNLPSRTICNARASSAEHAVRRPPTPKGVGNTTGGSNSSTRANTNSSSSSTTNRASISAHATTYNKRSISSTSASVQGVTHTPEAGLYAPAEVAVLLGSRYAMLSYQWDHQDTVKRARSLLEKYGVQCWMDIDQMKKDIYDSMAEGVQGAACVICFMSAAYQESANCKLELKFAQQSGVPIVPVMVQADWRASDWLGIITAGALWTPLYNEFETGIKGIISQMEKSIIPAAAPMHTDDSEQSSTEDDIEFSVEEMRGELGRLMADLHLAKKEMSTGAAEAKDRRLLEAVQLKPTLTAVGGGQCPLPAGVPPLPPGLRITAEMKQLLVALLAPASTPQIGFCGMGGIGKTTVSTWLVRQPQVRDNYNQVVWATFGQSPNIQKVQSFVYLQLTGSDISTKDMSDQEVLQSLQQAFVGKTVLLVLDDVWEREHTDSVCCIDDSTDSKVLLSSRVRSVLEGGDVVDISLPSDADAVQILLNEAGFNVLEHGSPPIEALEVVQFCNHLPLAIGIAGALLKNMGLDTDWSEVLTVLQEEFGEGGQVRAMENSVIRTSLKAIKGRQRDQIIQLFCGFALIPEDTFCPLEVLGMIFEATHPVSDGSMPKQTSRLLLRKWLKMLIDRSLVLGSVDRPQLHDIVLEFVIGQFSPEELKEAHRRLIRVFRRERPTPSGWQKALAHGDSLATYVTHEIGFHVANAWLKPDVLADVEGISWTDDLMNGHRDIMSIAACRYLGVTLIQQLAVRAESDEQWWSAAIRWMQVGEALLLTGGAIEAGPPLRRAMELIRNVRCFESTSTSASTQNNMEQFELGVLQRLIKLFDPADFERNKERFIYLSTTPAATRDPLLLSGILATLEIFEPLQTGDLPKSKAGAEVVYAQLAQAAKEHNGTVLGRRCLISSMLWTIGCFDKIPTWKSIDSVEDVFGQRGCKVEEVYALYTLQDFEDNYAAVGLDAMIAVPTIGIFPLLFYWGEVDKAVAISKIIISTHDALQQSDSHMYGLTCMISFSVLPIGLHMIGQNEACFEWIEQHFGSFDNINAVITAQAKDWPVFVSIAPIDAGLAEQGGEFSYIESLIDWGKINWLLTCPKDSIADPEAYFAKLNNPDEMMRVEMVKKGTVTYGHQSAGFEISPQLWAARAYERFELYDKALAHLDKLEEIYDNPHKYIAGCDPVLYQLSLARSCAGRILAQKGQMDEAAAKFEAAIADARAHKYDYLEALAIQDWIKYVLEPAGRAAEGAAALAAAMKTLGIGRREQVTELMASFSAL